MESTRVDYAHQFPPGRRSLATDSASAAWLPWWPGFWMTLVVRGLAIRLGWPLPVYRESAETASFCSSRRTWSMAHQGLCCSSGIPHSTQMRTRVFGSSARPSILRISDMTPSLSGTQTRFGPKWFVPKKRLRRGRVGWAGRALHWTQDAATAKNVIIAPGS